MAKLTLTLKVVKPWWWTTAVWLSAAPMFIRYMLTGRVPSDEETDAFAQRWADKLRFRAE